jgi:hypothetical protein
MVQALDSDSLLVQLLELELTVTLKAQGWEALMATLKVRE